MAKRNKAVRAELVVRMTSVDHLRRRVDAVQTDVLRLVEQMSELRAQVDRVDSLLHVLSAELIDHVERKGVDRG